MDAGLCNCPTPGGLKPPGVASVLRDQRQEYLQTGRCLRSGSADNDDEIRRGLRAVAVRRRHVMVCVPSLSVSICSSPPVPIAPSMFDDHCRRSSGKAPSSGSNVWLRTRWSGWPRNVVPLTGDSDVICGSFLRHAKVPSVSSVSGVHTVARPHTELTLVLPGSSVRSIEMVVDGICADSGDHVDAAIRAVVQRERKRIAVGIRKPSS